MLLRTMTEPSSPGPNRAPLLATVRALMRDRLFRRLVVASLFAAAFVWVAVDAYDVAPETVLRYLVLSIALVGVMIGAALLAALSLRLLRRGRSYWSGLMKRSSRGR
jgi:hypothetical protein